MRKAQILSVTRGFGKCRQVVYNYCTLALPICQVNGFLKPSRNVQRSLQINLLYKWTTKWDNSLLRTKSSRDAQVTTGKRGETINLIVCCIAEGNSVIYWVFKRKRNKNEFRDGVSLVSYRTMNKTAAYVTTVVFTDGLNNYLIPRKESSISMFILIPTSHNVQTLTFSTSMQKRCATPVSQNTSFAASRPSFLQTIKDTLAKSSEQMAAQ